MVDKDSRQETGSTTLGAGTRLKEARIAQGLSVKDVSSRLNLKIEIVEALENGLDEKLPVSTYVRGYIRSYAKIVNLDGNELIGLYENKPIAPPEIIPDMRTASQASSRDKPVRAVTYLVTFILALLLIAWLQGNYVIRTDIDKPETDNQDNANYIQEPQAMDETQQSKDTVYYYPGINLDDYSPANRERNDISEGPGTEASNPDLLELDKFQDDVQLPDDEINPTTPSTVTGDRLRFILNGESWIEVSDALNKKMYIGMAKAGEEIRLEGTAPFRILLGYSPAVKVVFNGKNFDTAPYSEAGIARFTLGE